MGGATRARPGWLAVAAQVERLVSPHSGCLLCKALDGRSQTAAYARVDTGKSANLLDGLGRNMADVARRSSSIARGTLLSTSGFEWQASKLQRTDQIWHREPWFSGPVER